MVINQIMQILLGRGHLLKANKLFRVIGALVVLYNLLKFLNAFRKAAFRTRKNLSRRYGLKSWVFVTGSSQGIGLAIAAEFAKLNFNIILCARTESKLLNAREHIQKVNPKVEIKILVIDFSRANEPDYLQERIASIESLDVSVLINNVGVDVLSYYHNETAQQIANLVTINCLTPSLLSRIYLPKLLDRTKGKQIRSAIVNVSSIAGEIPLPLHNVYSASKVFLDYLSRSLNYQYPSLDILSLRPSQVSTSMTLNRPTDILTITADQCAAGLMDDLGYETVSNGHLRHKMQSWVYSWVPERMFNYFWKEHIAPQFIKEREKARRSRQMIH